MFNEACLDDAIGDKTANVISTKGVNAFVQICAATAWTGSRGIKEPNR